MIHSTPPGWLIVAEIRAIEHRITVLRSDPDPAARALVGALEADHADLTRLRDDPISALGVERDVARFAFELGQCGDVVGALTERG